jgi:hypothetical protein
MYDQVSTALRNRQLTQAAQLLQRWQQAKPQDPWLLLAMANYWEARDDLEKAQTTYTRLLQNVSNSKILGQARQGLQRVQDQLAQRREHELLAARHRTDGQCPALLVLAPVVGESRTAAIQGLAQVMQLDTYTARMRLPSRYWRLVRVGPAGEIQYFWEQLRHHGTPAQWATIDQVKAVPVFRVQQVRDFSPELTVICQNAAGQKGTISLDWGEQTQWVVGQLPIFESVVDLSPWGRLQRKDATQDYAGVMDLHLQGRGCILRFCDRAYSYRDSAPLPDLRSSSPAPSLVAATYWNGMKALFQQHLPPADQDFTGFGQGALDYIDLLPGFTHYLDLARQQPSPWDGAFHLYSCLKFLARSHRRRP